MSVVRYFAAVLIVCRFLLLNICIAVVIDVFAKVAPPSVFFFACFEMPEYTFCFGSALTSISPSHLKSMMT